MLKLGRYNPKKSSRATLSETITNCETITNRETTGGENNKVPLYFFLHLALRASRKMPRLPRLDLAHNAPVIGLSTSCSRFLKKFPVISKNLLKKSQKLLFVTKVAQKTNSIFLARTSFQKRRTGS